MDTRWSSTTKLLVLIVLLVVGAWLLVVFSEAIPPLIVAFVLAYLLKPAADGLVRRTGWPRGIAILVIYLIILTVLILMPVLATPSLISFFSRITIDTDSLGAVIERLGTEIIILGPIEIDPADFSQQVLQGLQNIVTPFATGAVQIAAGVASSVIWGIFVLVVVFWLVKDSYKFEGWVIERLPVDYRKEATRLFHELGLIWNGFFRGELVLGIIVGTLVGLSMWILGLSNPLLLGIIAGIMEFIPTVGPALAAITAVIIAWFGGSSWLPISNLLLSLIVIIVYVIIFQFEQLYLLPRIVGSRVRLHPAIVFIGTIVGAIKFGILGVLLAAPMIASVRVIGNYIYRKMLDLEPFSTLPGTDPAAIEWRGMIRGHSIAGVLLDLDGTIADTDDQAVDKIAARLGPVQRIFPGKDARPFVRHLVMLAEGPINWLVTKFDQLNLDDEAFRLNNWLRRTLGYRKPEELTLIPGVDETLRELSANYKLALVTTRSRETVEHFLDDFGLAELFDATVTRDDVKRLKPHPEPILQAVEKLGLEPAQCVMVGDTSVDILAAQSAGVASIAVLCGFGQRQDLGGADVILDCTTELTERL